MNEELSGGIQGAGAWENRGWQYWEGFGRWGRKVWVMGVLKGYEAGETEGNYPAMLKMKVYQQGFFKTINGEINGKNFPRRLEMKVAKERGKKKTTN